MSTYRPTYAEAQAMGLCWLARHEGLPDIAILRAAVVNFHTYPCGWCAYPEADLMAMLRSWIPTPREWEAWEALPPRAKGEAIRAAQGEAAA